MQFLLNREGNISVFRVGIVFGILGIIGIGIGFLSFQLEVSNRQQPFNVALYPNATELDRGSNPERRTGQTIRYLVSGVTPEDVVAFYQAELDKHLGQNGSTQGRALCVRTPTVGNYETYVEGTGNLPYHYDCLFDNTFLDNIQYTKVRIHPGVRNDAENVNFEGNVVIIYGQAWSNP
ncbi:MAG: hypothetical protein SFZ02_16195 [bacterium]|nr:hypothetical protein [bacterium]